MTTDKFLQKVYRNWQTLCPKCDTSFKSGGPTGMAKCPRCGWIRGK